jgi:hypothetical protein
MPENPSQAQLSLDPWSASSLLQKAIRRGEAELARQAARTLYRYRGQAVFRRLCMIAVEDIGIADVSLLQEIARIGSDKALRAVLASDAEIIDDLCSRMAAATKDRSADYLYCAATKLEPAKLEAEVLKSRRTDALIEIAADEALPLIRRANAAMLACTVPGKSDARLRAERVEQLLSASPTRHLSLEDALLQLARINVHPFCLMLPFLWSTFRRERSGSTVVEEELPCARFAGSIPLYTFDFHTAVGKRAIERFARENTSIRTLLTRWASGMRGVTVAEIAAFYADAAPVNRRLDWRTGSRLAHVGFVADMLAAGCAVDGATPLLECTKANLPHLNSLREASVCSSKKCN